MNFIDSIVNFITDAKRKLTHRLMFAITCVLALIALNDIFGFSYYYATSRKVEQVAEINNILKDTLLDNPSKKYLLQLRNETLKRDNIFSQAAAFFATPNPAEQKRVDTVYVTYVDGMKVVSETKEFTGPTKNRYWHFISANLFWILLAFALPFLPLKGNNESVSTFIFTLVMAETIMIGYMFLWSWLLNLIPVLFGHPGWNYGLNVLLNVFLLVLLGYDEVKKRRAKR